MPFKIRKMPNQNCYEVYKPKSMRKFAKCTTLKKAKKQVALLNAIEHNPKFVTNLRNKTMKRNKRSKK